MIQETNSIISEDGGVIFGTNVSTSNVIAALESFVLNFEIIRDNPEKVYQQKLSDLGLDIGGDIFEVQGTHLKEFDREVYYQFIYFPAEMISCFDFVLKNLYEKYFITT
jgi:DNA replicative helicase MCM subunit Mcm2 (Cdc46/Mcm family)